MPPFRPAARAFWRAHAVCAALCLSTLAPLAATAAQMPPPVAAPVTAEQRLFPLGTPKAMTEALADDGTTVGDRFAADRMVTGAIGTPSRFWDTGRMPADRHILFGAMLLAVAMMASTAFGLWRWQLRGWTAEA